MVLSQCSEAASGLLESYYLVCVISTRGLRDFNSFSKHRGRDSEPFLDLGMADFIRFCHNDITHTGLLLHDTNISIENSCS